MQPPDPPRQRARPAVQRAGGGRKLVVRVADAENGRPAEGVRSALQTRADGGWTEIATGDSDESGVILLDRPEHPGVCRVDLDATRYFAIAGMTPVMPKTTVTIRLPDNSSYLLLQAFITTNSFFAAAVMTDAPWREGQ